MTPRTRALVQLYGEVVQVIKSAIEEHIKETDTSVLDIGVSQREQRRKTTETHDFKIEEDIWVWYPKAARANRVVILLVRHLLLARKEGVGK